jgi:hypothetical protein
MISSNPNQRIDTELLGSEKVVSEGKVFFLDLKENHRGRFLKITEDVGWRRNTIMLPASAFRDFAAAFAGLAEVERRLSA